MKNIYKKNKKIIFSLFLILIFIIISIVLFYSFNKDSSKEIYQIEGVNSSQAVDYKTTEIPENLGEVETFIHKNPLFSFLYPKISRIISSYVKHRVFDIEIGLLQTAQM